MNNVCAPTLTLRLATDKDSLAILNWRNDPQTRAMSRNHEEIAPIVHENWYQRILKNPNHLLLIGELMNETIGMVRFDSFQSNHIWEVSIMLAPEYKRKGISKPLLQLAIEHFRTVAPQNFNLIAEIKTQNIASKKLFESMGFQIISQEAGLVRYQY